MTRTSPSPPDERALAAKLCEIMHCEAGQITLHWARQAVREISAALTAVTPQVDRDAAEPEWAMPDAIVGHATIDQNATDLDGDPIWQAEVQCAQGDALAAIVWGGTKAEALARATAIAAALKLSPAPQAGMDAGAVLAWLGYYRDEIPPEAVAVLQTLLTKSGDA